MFSPADQRTALDRHAKFLEEAATERLLQETRRSSPGWRRGVVWRPVQFTLRFPMVVVK